MNDRKKGLCTASGEISFIALFSGKTFDGQSCRKVYVNDILAYDSFSASVDVPETQKCFQKGTLSTIAR